MARLPISGGYLFQVHRFPCRTISADMSGAPEKALFAINPAQVIGDCGQRERTEILGFEGGQKLNQQAGIQTGHRDPIIGQLHNLFFAGQGFAVHGLRLPAPVSIPGQPQRLRAAPHLFQSPHDDDGRGGYRQWLTFSRGIAIPDELGDTRGQIHYPARRHQQIIVDGGMGEDVHDFHQGRCFPRYGQTQTPMFPTFAAEALFDGVDILDKYSFVPQLLAKLFKLGAVFFSHHGQGFHTGGIGQDFSRKLPGSCLGQLLYFSQMFLGLDQRHQASFAGFPVRQTNRRLDPTDFPTVKTVALDVPAGMGSGVIQGMEDLRLGFLAGI